MKINKWMAFAVLLISLAFLAISWNVLTVEAGCGHGSAKSGCDMPGMSDHKHDPNTKQEPNKPAEQPKTAEQTLCPVMGGAINKDIFTVYKGKKVYFCCPGCKPKFEKNPEKYISKLPQFKK